MISVDSVTVDGISIHAPRAGGDGLKKYTPEQPTNFNPRPPCGGRLLKFESLFGFSNNSCMVIRFFCRAQLLALSIPRIARLLKRFFGANLSAKACVLPLRIRGLYYPRVNMLFCSQSAQFCFDICCQGNKSAGCPYPCPLYHTSALAGCGTVRHSANIRIPSIALSVRS